jgi:hypothetical protein
MGGIQVWLHYVSNTTLDGGEWSRSHCSRFIPVSLELGIERTPYAVYTFLEMKKILLRFGFDLLSIQAIAQSLIRLSYHDPSFKYTSSNKKKSLFTTSEHKS